MEILLESNLQIAIFSPHIYSPVYFMVLASDCPKSKLAVAIYSGWTQAKGMNLRN
jgi:hypothetical protein